MFCYISPYNKTDPKKNQVVKIPDISFEFILDLQLDSEIANKSVEKVKLFFDSVSFVFPFKDNCGKAVRTVPCTEIIDL